VEGHATARTGDAGRGGAAVTAAPSPQDEEDRLAALRALQILDTPAEERFDRLTRLASSVFDVPIALVSLVDADRQWFKSCVGMATTETDRSISFCAHAIRRDETFVVEDAGGDARFARNPLVTGEPHIRFYAGHPVRATDGQRVGTFCVLDVRPRSFSDREREILRELAAVAEAELRQHELNRAVRRQRDAEEQLRIVAASVAEGIVAIDLEGRIVFANETATRWFGDSGAEPLLGRAAASILVEPSPREIGDQLQRAALGGTVSHVEVVVRTATGAELPLAVSFASARVRDRTVYIASGRDLSEQLAAQREMERLDRRHRTILASTADGIVQIDPDGYAVYANPAAHRMLHLRDDVLVGQHLHRLVHHSRADGTPRAWEECPTKVSLDERRVIATQRDVYWRPDGTTFPVSFTSAPIVEDDAVTGAVVVFTDVSEQVEIERTKDEFVAMVSHELRTPLTSLKGSLGLVTGGVYGPLPERAQTMLEVAVSNTDRLVRLVNDILDLHRVDAGRLQLDLREQDIHDLVGHATAAVAAVFAAREISLEASLPGPGDLTLVCDGDRIVQVLTNLLGNAAKFSQPRTTVTVSAARAAAGERDLVVSVTDQGRGIPPERLDHIFERFEQVDSSDARHGSGSGLGLAIARALVEQHGGRLDASSTVGVGSAFTITLPLAGPGRSGS